MKNATDSVYTYIFFWTVSSMRASFTAFSYPVFVRFFAMYFLPSLNGTTFVIEAVPISHVPKNVTSILECIDVTFAANVKSREFWRSQFGQFSN